MCSEWLYEECPPLLSIHVTAANCRQRELGAVCALRGFLSFFFFFTLNQSVQLQRPELPLTLIFCTFLKKELFDKLKMLTQLKWESFKLGGEEKVV